MTDSSTPSETGTTATRSIEEARAISALMGLQSNLAAFNEVVEGMRARAIELNERSKDPLRDQFDIQLEAHELESQMKVLETLAENLEKRFEVSRQTLSAYLKKADSNP